MAHDSERLSDLLSRRKFLVASGAAGAVGLAGCSSGGDGGAATTADDGGDSADGSDTGGDGSDGDSGTDGDSGAGGDTALSVWYSIGGDKGDLVATLAEEYGEETDGVTLSASHEGSYGETFDAALRGIRNNDPPALAHLNAVHTVPTYNSGSFQPIQSIIDDVNPDDYIGAALDYYRVGDDDQFMALPFNASSPVLMYNKDAFADAGLDPEGEDYEPTFSAFRNVCEAIVDDAGFDAGATWGNITWFVENWFALQNQPFVNNENGRAEAPTEVNLDSEAAERFYTWWMDLYADDLYQLSSGWGDARQAFVNQDAAMLIDSSSNIVAQRQAAEEAGYEMGLLEVPSAENTWAGALIGGGAMFVPRGIDEQTATAAGEFAKWIASPEQQARWHKGTGYYPVHKDSIELLEEDGWFEEQDGMRLAMDQLLDSEDTPATRGALIEDHGQVRDLLSNGADRMFDGEDVSTVLSDVKTEVDDLLARSA
ncbi:extracellular solute-binding protein [Halorussus halobius]|uniref:extracellular solute-binding protein n=1 Tax=Halorussus halobius TaxID=1710537 RepID=UPI001092379F|nr:extracellular solute-binding protein [Halorussus halobius]